MLNILLIADVVSKIISLVIFVCLAMWSIRNLKVHDVSCAICNTSSGDKNYCKQGSFILYGRTGGAVYNSIDNWNNNAQCLLVDAHGDRPITKAAGSANAPGLLADAYGTQPIRGI